MNPQNVRKYVQHENEYLQKINCIMVLFGALELFFYVFELFEKRSANDNKTIVTTREL